jgi:biofilm PGA synthesis protein PgaA
MAISGGIKALSFTGSNHRLEGNLSFERRFIARPNFFMSAQPELYASRNTLPDAPYFNPPHDANLGVAVKGEHILWRRYEHSLRQEFRAGASSFWQANYPVNWVGDLGYHQVLRFDPNWYLHYGGSVARRVYDGRSVRDLQASVTLETKF